ncbi:hypothetical protein SSRP02_p036 [Synechococcus phage S-SRP02]|nr:hypothetical protein SSRP02_p036 [Synechococcus phage S-SRP02]
MCFGGGGSPAVITMPDTGAYDRMAQMQFDAMRSVQDGAAKAKQMELSQAISGQQQVLTDLRDLQTRRANDVAANAERMAALLGAPPPEKTAQAPVVGSDRASMARASGKRGLRIDRATATSDGAGTGLNITTGV